MKGETMPTKTIYVQDGDLEIFEKAKEVAGESLSSVIVQALKDYLNKKPIYEGMDYIYLWEGTEDYEKNIVVGKYVKFIGKLIGVGQSYDITSVNKYSLYQTRKGIYLLYTQGHDDVDNTKYARIDKHNDFNKIMSLGLPPELINSAIQKIKTVKYEDLDL
jgi:hypothetical protein